MAVHFLPVTLPPFQLVPGCVISFVLVIFHSGEWSLFVPVDYYQLVVPYMTQQYGDELTTQLALLVHTNTGCEYEDHSKWALWAGQKWQVLVLFFVSASSLIIPTLFTAGHEHLQRNCSD
jgi:hypothetical protein